MPVTLNLPSPLHEIKHDVLQNQSIRLYIKRDDLIHDFISGNKWRKLKYNLQDFQASSQRQLLTYGGAFSNHIYATAVAGKLYNIKTIGIIRGEKNKQQGSAVDSSTLTFAEKQGMHLHFVSRTAFSDKPQLALELKARFGDFYDLPEGGANAFAIRGCGEIVEEVNLQLETPPQYWCLVCGTGATLAGIIAASKPQQKILGFSALKSYDWDTALVNLLGSYTTTYVENDEIVPKNWTINTDYHFGGYAKWQPLLIESMNDFKEKHGIALDPIYTGKLFYGIFDLLKKGYFKQGSTIVALHTGGLQGIEGFNAIKLKNSPLKIV
jgi:1-aminocyclopropane-1-carboxylate deaminase